PASGTKAAFSSNRVTRGPVCRTSSAIWCSFGAGGSGRSVSRGGGGGGGRQVDLEERRGLRRHERHAEVSGADGRERHRVLHGGASRNVGDRPPLFAVVARLEVGP